MKIEKISDNQIRCTLTREDLASRKINLHELAYGSEKAKQLFQDMMHEAFQEYGFTVDNSPLMIEAIPLSGEAIVLIITRVDNPEELDSRFARFSHEDGSSSETASVSDSMSSLDDIVSLFSRLSSATKAAAAKEEAPSAPKDDAEVSLSRFFLFRDLETIIRAAAAISPDYQGWNSLYKNPEDGNFYLILRIGDTAPQEFNRICNVLTEYGVAVDYTGGMEEFFGEHMHTITSARALQVLRDVGNDSQQ